MEAISNPSDANSKLVSAYTKSNIPLVKLLRLANKCHSKWPLIGIIILHIPLLIYSFIYLKILYSDSFNVTLTDGTLVEIIPEISLSLITSSLSPVYNLFVPFLAIEMIYIEHGYILKEIFRKFLDDVVLVSVYFESIPSYLKKHTFIGRYLVGAFPDSEATLLLLCLLEWKYFRSKYVNFKYLLPQFFEFIAILLGTLIEPFHMFSPPLFDPEEIKIGKDHQVHKIIDVLVQKFQVDKKMFWRSDALVDETSLILDKCFAVQTLFGDYVFLNSNLVNGPFDLLKIIIYHEYGHVYQNASKISACIILFQKFLTLSVFFVAIYSNSKSSLPRDKTRLMLILLSFTCLTDSIFGCFFNLLGNYQEFTADDFSMSLHDDLSGIEAFFQFNKDISKFPRNRFAMLYPPWLPYFTHPSIYHRFQRQVSRFNN